MTTGEKIKYFRNMRGISQETLGQLSGINSATIKNMNTESVIQSLTSF